MKEFNNKNALAKHKLEHNTVSDSSSSLMPLENSTRTNLIPENALLCDDVTLEEESPVTCDESVHDVSEIVLEGDQPTHFVNVQEQSLQILESHDHDEPENTNDESPIKDVNVNLSVNSHIDCHKCDANFSTDLELEWHLATAHEYYETEVIASKEINEIKQTCDMCSFEASTSDILETHMHTKHTLHEHGGTCQLCNYEAKSQDDLGLHIIENHAFQCESCRMIFQSNELLLLHIKVIHKQRVFKCQKCDYSSDNSHHVEEHTKSVHTNSAILEYLTCQQDALSHAFKNFKEDLTGILKKIMDDSNDVKQELFILRQDVSQSKRFERIEKQLHNIEMTIRETGLVENTINQRPSLQKPVVPEPGTQRHNVNESKPKFTFIGDAIGRNFEIKTVEKAIEGDIRIKRAFSSISDIAENEAKYGTKHPDKLIQNVLKDHDSNTQSDVLVIQTGSVDITNLKTAGGNAQRFSDYHRNHTISAAENLFKEVENTLVKYPNLKKAIILKQTPRFDKKNIDPFSVKPAMAQLFNQILDQRWLESAQKNRLIIANHRLECSPGSYETRYRNRRSGQYDGVHMYGPSGRKAYTESLLFILRQAGLIKKSPPQYFRRYHTKLDIVHNTENEFHTAEPRSRIYSVPTSNKFSVLSQGN